MIEFDVSKPSAARMYDYALGGKDHYQADRDAVEAILKIEPRAFEGAHQNRAFLRRAVRHVAAQRPGGDDITRPAVTQYLDIGSGLPTVENTHEIVQKLYPATSVMYADNDPVVVAHANAYLAVNKHTRVIPGDLRDPAGILRNRELACFLDLDRPVCLILVAILHFLPDSCAYEATECLKEALSPGSWLIISHATGDKSPEKAERVESVYNGTQTPLTVRSEDQVTRFFDGFRLVDPGVVNVHSWRNPGDGIAPLMCYGGVARKP